MGFVGLMKYAQKPDAQFISSSTGADPQDFLRTCARLRESRPDCRVPVLHFSLSLPRPEHLDIEGWQEAASRFQNEMGLNGHDYFIVRHTDAEHDHVHFIASKIHPDGSLWKDSNSARRAMSACQKIEVEMKLTKTKTLDEFRAETGRARHVIKDNELQMMNRTGKVGDRRKAAITAKIAAEKLLVQQATEKKLANPKYIPSMAELKAVDAELIRQEKRKNQNHEHENKVIAANGTGNAAGNRKRGINSGSVQLDQKGNGKTPIAGNRTGKKVGEIRSYQRGEAVHFKQNGIVIARMEPDRIELFDINDEAIEFAILQAKKSGKVPLEPYSDNLEFIKAVGRVADRMGVPVRDEKAEQEMKRIEAEMRRKADAAAQQEVNNRWGNEMRQPLSDAPKPAPAPTIRMI
jgi:hypothetical protein